MNDPTTAVDLVDGPLSVAAATEGRPASGPDG
jgi:hypothetical protein